MALTKMTKEDWLKKGRELFGTDETKWRFICPGCHCVQSVEDFRQFKSQGADPGSAYCECLGRYTGGSSWTYDKQKEGTRCDYAAYGLFNISPVTVIDEFTKKETSCFAFDEGENTLKL